MLKPTLQSTMSSDRSTRVCYMCVFSNFFVLTESKTNNLIGVIGVGYTAWKGMICFFNSENELLLSQSLILRRSTVVNVDIWIVQDGTNHVIYPQSVTAVSEQLSFAVHGWIRQSSDTHLALRGWHISIQLNEWTVTF